MNRRAFLFAFAPAAALAHQGPHTGTPDEVDVGPTPSDDDRVSGQCPVCGVEQSMEMAADAYDMIPCLTCKNVYVIGAVPDSVRKEFEAK